MTRRPSSHAIPPARADGMVAPLRGVAGLDCIEPLGAPRPVTAGRGIFALAVRQTSRGETPRAGSVRREHDGDSPRESEQWKAASHRARQATLPATRSMALAAGGVALPVYATALPEWRPALQPRWTVRSRARYGPWNVIDGSTDRAEAEALFECERRARLSSKGRGGEVALFDPAEGLVEVVQFWQDEGGTER